MVARIHCGNQGTTTVLKNDNANQLRGTMMRMLKNEEGNIIAILAAAVIPVIGLVGGGVDMSRLYLTQSRLQGACDAGALMGRRTMGSGAWDANGGIANTQALRMFDQNFESGAYGSSGLTRSYVESGGNVTGTASVTVPMALMQVLGVQSKVITVSCQAESRVPNTDVMFVLDTTGSMGGTAAGSPQTKIAGLQIAVKCFYEALAKKNITDITAAACGETVDPSATNTGDVQLRFGFVPYAINVNVGRLLPLDYMANSWTYQSREATITPTATSTPTYGTESAPTIVSTVDKALADTAWTNIAMISVGGITYFGNTLTNSVNCSKLSVPPSSTATTTGTNELVSQSPTTPIAPDAVLTKTYAVKTVTKTRSYQRKFIPPSGGITLGTCLLQYSDTGQNVRTVTTRTTTPITWSYTTFTGWDYKPVTFDISGLKDVANNAWRTSVELPLGDNGAMTPIVWNGCIEERQTFRSTDADPADDWSPIPSSALDMDIDLVPTAGNAPTQWGPMLTGAVWQRLALTTDVFGKRILSSSPTLNNVWLSRNDILSLPRPTINCPAAARKYQTWDPAEFSNYVNSLTPDGFTYHDIGLLWGARIMSPTGIFAAENAPANMTIERHMVFMTDGATDVRPDDYSAYGIHWYDRRQTSPDAAPTETQLESITDARTAALCKAIKNKNITLWVISYGDVGTDMNAKLETCATPGRFFQATSVAALVANFKQIAAEISALRLTR